MNVFYTSRFTFWCLLLIVLAGGCQQVQNLTKPTVRPTTLRDVPAQRLGYRFETDVLAPPEVENSVVAPQLEKLTAIQADFDQNRPQESLERTVASPDKQRVLAVYQSVADEKAEFRLDLYGADGKLVRKITTESLALHFLDSIMWSPDSSTFAFAGARRVNSPTNQEIVQEAPRPPDLESENQTSPDPNAQPSLVPSPSSVVAVAAFRTEQIYLANRDGGELKPLTQSEGLRYFYFVWSPDSALLAALACKENEWQALEARAEQTGELLRPFGRPRVLEKTGNERRLDDALTNVDPVWSPDSSKVAVAFDKQIRIYDAIGSNPTAAALPLQVPLLIASQICDEKVAAGESCVNVTSSEVNANNAANLPTLEPTTFVPIVALEWTEDKTLYLQTGFVKEFEQGESVRSYLRWHRLNFSPQAASIK